MTSGQVSPTSPGIDVANDVHPDLDEPLDAYRDPLGVARDHIATQALRPSPVGPVGLELEFHLVDLADPARRPSWQQVAQLAKDLEPMPGGSTVTIEPGGQLELSSPPSAGLVGAIDTLRTDRRTLIDALAGTGYGTAPLGTDPARPACRLNPDTRYVAMERHFAALGCARAGREMMSSSAALQVNLDAGPVRGWAQRLERIHGLGPVLIAISACSPLLAGRSSGWHSMRQQIWSGIDGARSAAIPTGDPAQAWASYALRAPVMLVRDHATGTTTPVTDRVPLAAWVCGHAEARGPLRRRPALRDLDYHLSTLFPPVRLRGYVELRCLDAVPDRWWPALAALTVTLIDDDVAAERATELCEPVRDAWQRAARDGLADPQVRAAALGCVDIAARRCPAELRGAAEEYADLITRGLTPGDELRDRSAARGPLRMLREEADA